MKRSRILFMSSTDKLQSTEIFMHTFSAKIKNIHTQYSRQYCAYHCNIVLKAVENTFNLLDGNTKASLFMTFVYACGVFLLVVRKFTTWQRIPGGLVIKAQKIYRKLFKHLCIREPKVC